MKFKPISFWKPSKPTKLKSKPLFAPKFIQPVKLSQYPSRTKSEWKLIDRQPFGDRDRDRVPNIFDCKPLNRRKQGASKLFLQEVAKEVMGPAGTGVNIKNFPKYKHNIHYKLKKYYPNMYKKHIGTTSKVVGPEEIIRALAKDPTLYSEYKKNKVRLATSLVEGIQKDDTHKTRMATYYPAGTLPNQPTKEVVVRPVMPMKENLKTILKHEVTHAKQPTKEMKAEQKIIERQLKRKLRYNERPREIEAYAEERLPTERDLAKTAGPKPEALKSLQDDDYSDVESEPVSSDEREEIRKEFTEE